ncbi:RepB family plasmid replication initiator protein [Rufibacter immobilis]|uniref:RepB family plasmid replication initiator protein n=1 Tax=Rufibacter immobilis TaxID=1348778 RepID=A0A3M9MZG3_9BACT|nr:replication initiation protein [Rufibacter immobilis]RNI30924.1 RepB family plasmid replication initiator protein [Rufibacter immobilis]
MEIVKHNTTISHANSFIEGVYDMNLIELRIFLSLLSKHKRGVNVFKEAIPLTLKDLELPIAKSTFSEQLSRLKKTTDRLSDIKFKFETDSTYQPLHIFTPVLDKDKKAISVKLSLEIQELVNIWTNNFTEADVETLMQIPTFTSYRIYMLLKQYQTWKSERVITLDDLRDMLKLSDQKSYEVYGNLKNRILKPAQEHLKSTDMSFELKEIKSGKAVRAVVFKFKKKDKRVIEVKQAELFSPTPEEPNSTVASTPVLTDKTTANAIRIMRERYEFTQAQIDRYISKLKPTVITKLHNSFQTNPPVLTKSTPSEWLVSKLEEKIK